MRQFAQVSDCVAVEWWSAAEVLFTIGLVLLLLALLAETAFACCHCGLYRAWVPTLVGSVSLAAGTKQH